MMPDHLCGDALKMPKLPCCVHRGAAGNFTSPIRPMGAWLREMTGVDLDSRGLWPVCYGGNLGAARKNIERVGKEYQPREDTCIRVFVRMLAARAEAEAAAAVDVGEGEAEGGA